LGLNSYNHLEELKQINNINKKIEYYNIKRHQEPDNLEWCQKISENSLRLKRAVERHEKIYGEQEIYDRLKYKSDEPIYKNIRVIYVTFKSMQTKNIL
jgi:hypothetical protein